MSARCRPRIITDSNSCSSSCGATPCLSLREILEKVRYGRRKVHFGAPNRVLPHAAPKWTIDGKIAPQYDTIVLSKPRPSENGPFAGRFSRVAAFLLFRI